MKAKIPTTKGLFAGLRENPIFVAPAGGTLTRGGRPVITAESLASEGIYFVLHVRRIDFAAAGLTHTGRFSADLITRVASADSSTLVADDGTDRSVGLPLPALAGAAAHKPFGVKVSHAPGNDCGTAPEHTEIWK